MNKTTRRITIIFVILLAFAGFEHGYFEFLQGNKKTDGFIIQAIGKSMQLWEYGSEEAFTIIPNFFITGIITMCISFFIVVWGFHFVYKKHGVKILLLLFIILTLTGGGLGFIPFYIVTCAYASRINAPLTGWRKVLKRSFRKRIRKLWVVSVPLGALSWLLLIELAVFGYFPGIKNPEILMGICNLMLFFTMIFLNISYISGFTDDIRDENYFSCRR